MFNEFLAEEVGRVPSRIVDSWRLDAEDRSSIFVKGASLDDMLASLGDGRVGRVELMAGA